MIYIGYMYVKINKHVCGPFRVYDGGQILNVDYLFKRIVAKSRVQRDDN